MMSDEEKNAIIVVKVVKVFLVCLLVWSCLFVISGIACVLKMALGEAPGLFQCDFYTIVQVFLCLFICPIGSLEFSIFAWKQLKTGQQTTPQVQGDYYFEKYMAQVNMPTFFLALCLFGFGVGGFVLGIIHIFANDTMEQFAGRIVLLQSLGTIIFAGIPYFLIKWGGTQEQRKEKRQKKETDSRQAVCEKLLSVSGMRFFVKYYAYFRDWNTSDILDIVREDFQQGDIHKRIEAAQKIFQNNLEQLALGFISKSSKIDEDTKDRAQRLLQSP